MAYNYVFHAVPFLEVLGFVKFDLFGNDVFVFGNTVMRQLRGVAIGGGGTCSTPFGVKATMGGGRGGGSPPILGPLAGRLV